MAGITDMTAVEIAASVASRTLSATDVTQAYLDRIAELNPVVNAVCTLSPHALEDAAAIGKRMASGAPARPLEGVPFLVKDNIETKSLRTTFGSRLMADNVPAEDAVCVARLRAAGGVLLGKTNTPEFAHDINTSNLLFGTTRNPWHLMHTAGGSSGGSGAAVAAGFAPLALGTDLGGSIRIPASFNGLVGIRPSPGRVPVYPTDFAWDTLVPHVIGPLTTTVADAALMLSVIAGPDDRDPSSLPMQDQELARAASGQASLAGRRIALSIDLGGLVPVEPEVAALTRKAAKRFEALGAHVEEIAFDASNLAAIIAGTRSFGMVARYADRYDQHRDQMTAQLRSQVEAAFKLDVRTITQAERLRTAYWHRVNALMTRFDHILTPAVGAPPFRLDQPVPATIGGKPVARYYDVFLTAYAFSVTGLPVVALPSGVTAGGLPVGLQLVARRHREDRALEAAGAYAAAHPGLFGRPRVDPSQAGPIPEVSATPGMASVMR